MKLKLSQKRAMTNDAELIDVFKQAISQLPDEVSTSIEIVRWTDITHTEHDKYVNSLRLHHEKNELFAILIDTVVQAVIDAYEADYSITEEVRVLLKEYILNELSILMLGVYYNGNRYSHIMEPTLIFKNARTSTTHLQESMVRLFDYVRYSHELSVQMNPENTFSKCDVYSIMIPTSELLLADRVSREYSIITF